MLQSSRISGVSITADSSMFAAESHDPKPQQGTDPRLGSDAISSMAGAEAVAAATMSSTNASRSNNGSSYPVMMTSSGTKQQPPQYGLPSRSTSLEQGSSMLHHHHHHHHSHAATPSTANRVSSTMNAQSSIPTGIGASNTTHGLAKPISIPPSSSSYLHLTSSVPCGSSIGASKDYIASASIGTALCNAFNAPGTSAVMHPPLAASRNSVLSHDITAHARRAQIPQQDQQSLAGYSQHDYYSHQQHPIIDNQLTGPSAEFTDLLLDSSSVSSLYDMGSLHRNPSLARRFSLSSNSGTPVTQTSLVDELVGRDAPQHSYLNANGSLSIRTPGGSDCNNFQWQDPPLSRYIRSLAMRPRTAGSAVLVGGHSAVPAPQVKQDTLSRPLSAHPTASSCDPSGLDLPSTVSTNEQSPSTTVTQSISSSPVSIVISARPLPPPKSSHHTSVSPVLRSAPFMNIRPILSTPPLSIPRESPIAMRWSRILPVTSLTSSLMSSSQISPLTPPYSPKFMSKSSSTDQSSEMSFNPPPTRSHTATVINDEMFIFGGCDDSMCRNTVMSFDTSTMSWKTHLTFGKKPSARRAHSASAYKHYLIIFGGGDGPSYFNDVAILDTHTFQWIHPVLVGESLDEDNLAQATIPRNRRAHVSWVYQDAFYVYGGGDGARALTDLWRLGGLETLDGLAREPVLEWTLISTIPEATSATTPATRSSAVGFPIARGYHTATRYGRQLVLYGGSDARECFSDVWSLHLDTLCWKRHITRGCSSSESSPTAFTARLAHSAVAVGPYLVVVGGHDGIKYSRDVRVLDVRSMYWLDDAVVQRKWIQHASRAKPPSSDLLTTKYQNPDLPFVTTPTHVAGNASSAVNTPVFSAMPLSHIPQADMNSDSVYIDSRLPLNTEMAYYTNGSVLTLNTDSVLSSRAEHRPQAQQPIVSVQPRRQRIAPSSRGYHSAVLIDQRIVVFGGFNGVRVFDDMWALDLGFRTYLLSMNTIDEDIVGSIDTTIR
ncbi:hypothetical protein BASA60_008451 [Batrachochytrium salamandrivorans]|nr:hypothetical protein BASA60_008451 [Batrachochytrium salamandrivorans]KAH9254993.1 hypothetical protein BASA81_006938 [Batrachochytrium salamandrivorans]